ncbi:uncharacterized protein LOC132937269 [Metopolophium dirhodum]|uniref:uncharacterized protein LOC132937269 n=1 Tax=Metopolophium dirhodum TaxID=44670 RepID=UPI00299044C3|nr:uncharacterized protein LOC132937269 [Metopolophium dirhodum]
MADQDVSDMLTVWGLETYVNIFKEHGIDISCLTLITDEMMKEIIPMVGHRAKFKVNLEEWRKVITQVNDQSFNNMVRMLYLSPVYLIDFNYRRVLAIQF